MRHLHIRFCFCDRKELSEKERTGRGREDVEAGRTPHWRYKSGNRGGNNSCGVGPGLSRFLCRFSCQVDRASRALFLNSLLKHKLGLAGLPARGAGSWVPEDGNRKS